MWRALGLVIGMTAGLLVVSLMKPASEAQPQMGLMLSECDGTLRRLVIHYESAGAAAVEDVYRQFLPMLGSDVTVYVVCPDRGVMDRLCSAVGAVQCRLEPVIVGHAMTSWSRDRWVALAPVAAGSPATLWHSHGEAGATLRPGRAGDELIAGDLAAALGPGVRSLRSQLFFDAGDFLADSRHVFVSPRVRANNLGRTVKDSSELVHAIESVVKKRAILLDDAPEHHLGMFMMSVGENTMLVGDPRLARACLASAGPGLAGVEAIKAADADDSMPKPSIYDELPGGCDFSEETQRRFDAVAMQCIALGYRVVRIPTVPAADGRTFLTYVNVILDQRDDRRIVYLPIYQDADTLNKEAARVWRSLGFDVREVDCTSVYRYFGCLHCLVNVLERN